MCKKERRIVTVGAVLLFTLVVTGGVLRGEQGDEPSTPTNREELIRFAVDHGEKTELKGPHVVIHHREFLTRFTTDHKPARKVEAPSQNILRFSIWDRGPKMRSPLDFGIGKDGLFIELYNPKARESVLRFLTGPLLPIPLLSRTPFSRMDQVYTMCFDIGFDGFNNNNDLYVDEHNILQRRMPIDHPVSRGELKGTFNQKMMAQGQQLCEILVAEVYEAIAEGRTVEEAESSN